MGTYLSIEKLPRTVSLDCCEGEVVEFSYIDQRKLPQELVYETTKSWCVVIEAIKVLAVRGAPALGVTGGAALALWASYEGAVESLVYEEAIRSAATEIIGARPTAVNLEWGVCRVLQVALDASARGMDPRQIAAALYEEVKFMEAEDEATNRALGQVGAHLLPENARVLTHCNAGSLATVFYGTALGVVYAAAQHKGIERVYADETRPVGQGSRLTVWELAQVGIPVTLLCDNMAASLMAQGKVDAVVVGADRIAENGDTANKIGTYGVAVLAREHGIPFYVAAPLSTIDFSIQHGGNIPIEQRSAAEVLAYPVPGVDVWNPSFDVTPARYITQIITERGAFLPEEIKTLSK